MLVFIQQWYDLVFPVVLKIDLFAVGDNLQRSTHVIKDKQDPAVEPFGGFLKTSTDASGHSEGCPVPRLRFRTQPEAEHLETTS